MGLPGFGLSNHRLFFPSLKEVIVVKFQSSCRFSDHLANPKNLLANVLERHIGSGSPPAFHLPRPTEENGTPTFGGNILRHHVHYFRILGLLVPRKHVPEVLPSALGTPGGLSLPCRCQAKARRGWLWGAGEAQESRICWGLPFKGECAFSLDTRWAELPVSRARFQHRNVSKLKREERNCQSDRHAAPFWLWTDRKAGESPLLFWREEWDFLFKALGGGTSCLEGNKGWGLALSFVGDGETYSRRESLLPTYLSRGTTPQNKGLSLTKEKGLWPWGEARGREEREGVARCQWDGGWGAYWWLVENEGCSGAGQCCFWAPHSQECVRCEVGQGRESHLPPLLLFSELPTLILSHWEVPWHEGSLSLPTHVDFRAQPPTSS